MKLSIACIGALILGEFLQEVGLPISDFEKTSAPILYVWKIPNNIKLDLAQSYRLWFGQ
ncbi:hypothetical protein [Pseudomonas savastanoi]|uniref:hypothetical protein n=1 Tax=Pseudomonas savastanoi TaxID=29438 RepID=UPI0015CF326A|nr:hypothetical protein [Pseudomonas savastanoi]